jgi:predicted GTPase
LLERSLIIFKDQVHPVHVVLLGSSGEGKSTFGNFLFNNGIEEEPIFPRGEENEPCTDHVETRSLKIINPTTGTQLTLNIMDTPGLNESAEKDLHHMKEILEKVKSLHYISCVVLCLQFGFRTGTQFLSTLSYYKQLFHPLFAKGILNI